MSIDTIKALQYLMVDLQSAMPALVEGVPLPEQKAAAIADDCEKVIKALTKEPIDPRFVAVPDKEV